MKRLLCLLSLCCFSSISGFAAIDLVVSGGPFVPLITASNLVAGPGTDFVNTIQLASFTLSVSQIGNGKKWTVYGRTALTYNFPSGRILVTRTGGSDSTLQGGVTPILLGPTNTALFTGEGKIANIPVLAQVSGMTLAASPPGNYDASIIFEVVQN